MTVGHRFLICSYVTARRETVTHSRLAHGSASRRPATLSIDEPFAAASSGVCRNVELSVHERALLTAHRHHLTRHPTFSAVSRGLTGLHQHWLQKGPDTGPCTECILITQQHTVVPCRQCQQVLMTILCSLKQT